MAIHTSSDLKQAILNQQRKVELSKEQMKDQFRQTKENLRPVNLIKNTFSSVAGNSTFKSNLLKTGLGIGAALLTKRMVSKGGGGIAGKALNVAMNLGLVGAIANPIKKKGLSLLKKLLHRGNGQAAR